MSCDLQVLPFLGGGSVPSTLFSEPLIDRARAYATKCLRGVVRSDPSEPALRHAVRVAEVVADLGSGIEGVALALLHDVLEDGDGSVSRIRRLFGRSIAEGVVALTKPALGPRALRRNYYHQVLLCSGEDIQTVKLADFLDNARSRAGTTRGARTLRNALSFAARLRAGGVSPQMVRRVDRIETLLLETDSLRTAA